MLNVYVESAETFVGQVWPGVDAGVLDALQDAFDYGKQPDSRERWASALGLSMMRDVLCRMDWIDPFRLGDLWVALREHLECWG